MRKYIKIESAASMIEYIILLVLLMLSILLMQKYVVRGIAGRWKQVGDTFSYGKQYDPQRTVECAWSEYAQTWYETSCYDNYMDVNFSSALSGCEQICRSLGDTGSCGGTGENTVCTITFGPIHFHDRLCCYKTCERRCDVSVSSDAAGECSDPEVSLCNVE